jgi:hypothetical protein
MHARRILTIGIPAGLILVGLTGCNAATSGRRVLIPAAVSTPATSATLATLAATVASTPPVQVAPASSIAVTTSPASTIATTRTASANFAAAKQQWVQGAAAISADTGTYLVRAAADLDTAAAPTTWVTAVRQLRQLAALPETDDTAIQQAEAHGDIAALNTFFGTVELYD